MVWARANTHRNDEGGRASLTIKQYFEKRKVLTKEIINFKGTISGFILL